MVVKFLPLTQAGESYKLNSPENMDPLPPPRLLFLAGGC